MKELISVIIPIYMVEKYLNKCIDSVINQTYKNLEIILVNDGSKDNCKKICEEYAKKDSRIKIINKSNGGLSDARNKGLEVSNGKYIGFVDSDDYISKDMYKNLYENIIKYDADIAICEYIEVNENGENIKENKKIIENGVKIYSREEAMYKLLEDNEITNHVWNKLYKSSLFKDIEFPKGLKFEDIAVMYKLIDKANRVVHISEILYFYVQRDGSILNMRTEDLIETRIKIDRERLNFLENKKYNKENLLKNKVNEIIHYHLESAICNFKKFYKSEIMKKEYDELMLIDRKKIMKIIGSTRRKIIYIILKINRNIAYYIIRITKK